MELFFQSRRDDMIIASGTRVPDPYRWLEDDRSEETAAWVKEKHKVTYGYLETISFQPLS